MATINAPPPEEKELESKKTSSEEKPPAADEVMTADEDTNTRVPFNPGWKFYCLFGVLSGCTLVVALDANIVAVALPVRPTFSPQPPHLPSQDPTI